MHEDSNHCPLCGAGGDYFQDSPRAEEIHYTARALWALHKHRQALRKQGRDFEADGVSRVIRNYEEILEITHPEETH